MFLSAKVQNAAGELLDLTSPESKQKFILASIQGLNPSPAQLNIDNIYGMDGGKFNSAFRNTRNIVLTMLLRGDQEANRQELYDYFDTKEPCRFFFQNNNRNVFIDAIVETIENDMFQRTGEVQISMISPDPFFRDIEMQTIELSNSQGCFEFPVSINANEPIPFGTYESARVTEIINNSHIDLPVEIFIKCKGTRFQPKIQNLDTGEYIDIVKMTSDGEEIYINTDPANLKAVSIIDGVSSNIFASLEGSTFFQLPPGVNHFGYRTLGGLYDNDGTITINFRQLYTGI